MSDLKRITPDKLLWLDLEMTGLDPRVDRILEVAAVITDWNFRELASFETGVIQDAEALERLRANPFAASRPVQTEELITHALHGISEQAAQEQLVTLVGKHFAGPALLAGNSIHADRGFIRQYWTELEERLHYRMLDVSAWKVVMIGKYQLVYEKQEKHRALDDIRESIAELQFYLRHFTER